MTSEVKGHFYKVDDNYVKCMCKFFVKISWIIHDLEALKVTISYWMNSWVLLKISVKVIHQTIFSDIQWLLMWKVIFTKLLIIVWNACVKFFVKISWIILWSRSFKNYDFILNDFIDKNFRKGHTLNNFFRTFNDLWGQELWDRILLAIYQSICS